MMAAPTDETPAAAAAAAAPALADVPYDELVVDRHFGPFAETVSAEMAGRLAGPIGVGEPVSAVPPAVFPVLFLKALRRAMGGIPAGACSPSRSSNIAPSCPSTRRSRSRPGSATHRSAGDGRS